MNRKEHWESVFASKGDEEVSWTQAEPVLSLSLISEVCPSGRVIDVGGGSSQLADRLLDRRYSVAVLDISEAAIKRVQERLGTRGDQIRWIVSDITSQPIVGNFDVWHDRAVFHFLTEPSDRTAYLKLLADTIPIGGHAIIATFALDGPEKCSGLEVRRYSGATLAAELGPHLQLIKNMPEIHTTPWGKPQSFQYSVFRHV